MANHNKRVIKYKKPRNINIGIIIFSITFIYILINIALYFSKDRIRIYEVVEGKSASSVNSYYTGLVIRDEEVTYASNTGYINFYARDASHVAVGSNLYTIDEGGKIAEMLENASESATALSDDCINTIKEDIYKFTTSFNSIDFSSVYDFKYSLDSTVVENYNITNVDNINVESFPIVKSEKAGTVLYFTDNYETINIDNFKENDFSNANYKKTIVKSNDLIEAGAPIFKTITSENWYILIPLNDEEVERYNDGETLEVKFSKDELSTYCEFDLIQKSDGTYGKLSFNKYNIRYVYDRFLEFKIVEQEQSGLKIPKSSVLEKDFYVVPKEYSTEGGNNNTLGFNKEVYVDGQVSVVFETPTIYQQDDKYYYVDKTAFNEGDVLIKNESASRYQIKTTKQLKGVYNINNGYTNFRQIEVLVDTNDYYIIKSNTKFGLVIYDQIVLNADIVKENQVVYQ